MRECGESVSGGECSNLIFELELTGEFFRRGIFMKTETRSNEFLGAADGFSHSSMAVGEVETNAGADHLVR